MSQRGVDQVVKRTPFKLGQKRVYLPNFRVTLLRTPSLPPNYATFEVPLSLNKLDFRDYLLNAYNIRTVSITSRVHNLPVVDSGKPSIGRPAFNKLYRPAPIKKMTVLMEQPFVWPEEPKEEELVEKWSKNVHKEARKAEETTQERRSRTFVDEEARKKLAEQARELLKGTRQWKSMRRAEGSWSVRPPSGEDVDLDPPSLLHSTPTTG